MLATKVLKSEKAECVTSELSYEERSALGAVNFSNIGGILLMPY